MGLEEIQNKLKELEEKGLDVSFHKKILEGINLMDRQLSEDKELLCYLIDNNLVGEAEKEKIRKLIERHTEEFNQ